jgi:hypothetical protein
VGLIEDLVKRELDNKYSEESQNNFKEILKVLYLNQQRSASVRKTVLEAIDEVRDKKMQAQSAP